MFGILGPFSLCIIHRLSPRPRHRGYSRGRVRVSGAHNSILEHLFVHRPKIIKLILHGVLVLVLLERECHIFFLVI